MNNETYNRISFELQELSKSIPLNWGQIQNNCTDNKIDMFNIESKSELEFEIKSLSIGDQNYFRRRWFLWQCSKVDEFLFYKEKNVNKNPDSKDQNWDIEFNNKSNLRFDVKGTIIPKDMRDGSTIPEERELIKYYYDNQSKGVRHNFQNRLFIVHHSFRQSERSMFLRCHWDLKKVAYQNFNTLISEEMELISYKNAFAKCIFIIESKTNEFTFKIN